MAPRWCSEPQFLQIEVGDTVNFVPTEPGHNAEVIKGMFPEGGTEFKGKINEAFSVTSTLPCLWVQVRAPLWDGYVGLIVVGDDPTNLPPLPKQRARLRPRPSLPTSLPWLASRKAALAPGLTGIAPNWRRGASFSRQFVYVPPPGVVPCSDLPRVLPSWQP